MLATERDRADVARESADAGFGSKACWNPARLVFVDETGAATNMARRYGRSPRGQRLDGPIPHGHWKSTTFVGGLTSRGFIAPYVLDGAMNGDHLPGLGRADAGAGAASRATSSSWTTCRPQGRRHPRGDRGARRRAALPAALLARPQPDRAGLRQAQGPPAQGRRTIRSASPAQNASLLPFFSAPECASYLRHAGYAAT